MTSIPESRIAPLDTLPQKRCPASNRMSIRPALSFSARHGRTSFVGWPTARAFLLATSSWSICQWGEAVDPWAQQRSFFIQLSFSDGLVHPCASNSYEELTNGCTSSKPSRDARPSLYIFVPAIKLLYFYVDLISAASPVPRSCCPDGEWDHCPRPQPGSIDSFPPSYSHQCTSCVMIAALPQFWS